MPRSTSIAKSFTTVIDALISKLPVLICRLMLFLHLSPFFHADKTDGYYFLDIFDSLSSGARPFEIRSGWTLLARR